MLENQRMRIEPGTADDLVTCQTSPIDNIDDPKLPTRDTATVPLLLEVISVDFAAAKTDFVTRPDQSRNMHRPPLSPTVGTNHGDDHS